MEGNNKLTRAQLLASPPMRLEDVDAWLEKYNAVIDAARAEALRVERLRDAAPDLVKALRDAKEALKDAFIEGFFSMETYNDTQLNDENESFEKSLAKHAVARIDAALAKAGAA